MSTGQRVNHRAEDFLREQMQLAESKIAQLRRAVHECDNCLESEGLQAMLRTAQIERDLIRDLLHCQQDTDTLSLEAQIMTRVQCAQRTMRRQMLNWRRGHHVPPAYWDAEIREITLQDLLQRFHAWTQGRALYPEVGPRKPLSDTGDHGTRRRNGTRSNGHKPSVHPWYMDLITDEDEDEQATRSNGTGRVRNRGYSRSAEMLEEDIAAALEHAGIAHDHLEIIAEPLGNVIITGIAHGEDQQRHMLDTILNVDGVFEVIEDIKITRESECPICHPERNGNGARRNGSRA